MATNITTATTTTIEGVGGPGKKLFVKVTGTWGGTSLAVKTQNGNSEWEDYPQNATHTADFAHIFTVGEQKNLQLVTTGGSGIDLWAEVFEID